MVLVGLERRHLSWQRGHQVAWIKDVAQFVAGEAVEVGTIVIRTMRPAGFRIQTKLRFSLRRSRLATDCDRDSEDVHKPLSF